MMQEDFILKVEHLTKVFGSGKDRTVAVQDVSFQLKKGCCMGLIGESGSGKSTTARIIAGLYPPTSGKITFFGKRMQMVFQNPTKSFPPHMTILHAVCEGLRYCSDFSRHEIELRAMEALEMVQLGPEFAKRDRGELSGGQLQRAAIARAIISHPDLLLCDEVTSALDVSVQAQIIDLLQNLQKELNMTCLFISHDIALVSQICDEMIVMKSGIMVETGVPSQVIACPKEDYTKLLIDSVPVL